MFSSTIIKKVKKTYHVGQTKRDEAKRKANPWQKLGRKTQAP